MSRPSRIEIDQAALAQNLKALQKANGAAFFRVGINRNLCAGTEN